MADKVYANGIFWNLPHEKAPDFVLGSISIDIEKFDIEELRQYANGKYVRLTVKQGREKPYIEVDTYKKEDRPARPARDTRPVSDLGLEDIPF